MSGDVGRLLIFRVRGVRYGLDLLDVSEVHESFTLYPIPRAPATISGALNSHGTLAPVIDLGAFLGAGSLQGEGTVLVLDRQRITCALLAEQVETVVSFDQVLGTDEAEEPEFARLLVLADGLVRQLSLEGILVKTEELLRSI
jgi:chemotaxis signal transduction protein